MMGEISFSFYIDYTHTHAIILFTYISRVSSSTVHGMAVGRNTQEYPTCRLSFNQQRKPKASYNKTPYQKR